MKSDSLTALVDKCVVPFLWTSDNDIEWETSTATKHNTFSILLALV